MSKESSNMGSVELINPYIITVMALMINLTFVLILALISTFRSSVGHRSWNSLYFFNDKGPVKKFLIQFIYQYENLTIDFATCDFYLKFYDSSGESNIVRIPKSFFRENNYNKQLFSGEKIQFLLVT